jgi:class 3 adenylate cyclase
MAPKWDYDRSLNRVRRRYDEVAEIEISDLTRPIDFEKISLLHPRRVRGVHLYADITNFPAIVGDNLSDRDARKVLRRLHLEHREVTRVCEAGFGAAKVHFQGPRLHAVTYLPINDDEEIVVGAVAFAAATRHVVEICNSVFDGEPWDVAVGMDLGDAVATRNNVRGDRELLFLGAPANYAAKIVDTDIVATDAVVDALPTGVPVELIDRGDGTVSLDLDDDDLEALVDEYGWDFDPKVSEERIRDELDKWPLSRVGLTGIEGPIDKEALGLANSKRVDAAIVFADIDGFTAYVDDASESDKDVEEAVRAYHVIRSEMRAVAVEDCEALRIQYQGDRIQAALLLPVNDDCAIAERVVDLGAGLNASVVHTLPEVIGDAALPLAIGAAFGTNYVSRVGEHGDRDILCVGIPNEKAASIQLALDGGQFGIDETTFDLLGSNLQRHFKWSEAKDCYIATELTSDALARSVAAAAVIRSTGRPYHPGEGAEWG